MKRRGVAGLAPAVLGVLLVVWSVATLQVGNVRVWEGVRETWNIFRIMFGQPELAYLDRVVDGLRESLEISVVGTALAAVLAIPFGFWAARSPSRAGSARQRLKVGAGLGKLWLNAVRSFPELLLAIVFLRAVGLGPFAGVLAMGLHSTGMLGKLYAEVIESIDTAPVEALHSVGANRLQILWYAVLPQVLPDFASYALYRLEINVRAANVLGLVGAGGIGQALFFATNNGDWGRVGLILYGIIAVVTVIDYGSGRLRKRLA
ncbi:MAG: phosphonate ABC transporter, permease protein PhnE [Bacillota bacterium]